MIGYFRDLRLIPIAMVASACLLVLLAADLVLGHVSSSTDSDQSRSGTNHPCELASGLRVMDERRADKRSDGRRGDDKRADDKRGDNKRSWAQQMFNFPDSKPPVRERDDFSLLPAIAPLSGDRPHPDVTGAMPAGSSDKGAGGKDAGEAQAASEPEAGQGRRCRPRPRTQRQALATARKIRRRRPTVRLLLSPMRAPGHRRPSGRFSSACSNGGRSLKSAHASSTFARA